jgi:signal transduction histidine kinase
LPISRQSRLSAIFYLENDLLPGVFSSKRLTVLEILAAQVAISIDNSKLYKASQDAIRLRDNFLSIASHELKTPLTPLKIQLQTLMDHLRKDTLQSLTPEKKMTMIERADRQITRLHVLIEELLDVTRISSGQLSITPTRFDLSELIRELADRLSDALRLGGCTLNVEVPASLPGRWDRLRLEQAVGNLVTNAIKYAPRTEISLQVSATGKGVLIAVKDRGIGIGTEDTERVFERFERVLSAQNVSGLGLGLYIVRQIAEAHGGTIRVESTLGQGSTFLLELPLHVS